MKYYIEKHTFSRPPPPPCPWTYFWPQEPLAEPLIVWIAGGVCVLARPPTRRAGSFPQGGGCIADAAFSLSDLHMEWRHLPPLSAGLPALTCSWSCQLPQLPAHTEPVQPRQGRTPWALEAGAGARAKQGEMLTLSQSMQGRCRMWREQSQTRGLIISLSLLSGLCFHLESPRDTAPSQREGEEGLSTERFSLGSGRATVVGLFLSFLWLNGCVKADFAHWENTEGSILLSPLRMELRTWSTKL